MVGTRHRNSADAESLSRWWETFGDEQLTALVRRAVEGNLDVRTAMSRVREARATMRSTRTQLWPSADVGGSARASGTGNEAGISGVTDLYSLEYRRELGDRCVRRHSQHGRRRERHGRST